MDKLLFDYIQGFVGGGSRHSPRPLCRSPNDEKLGVDSLQQSENPGTKNGHHTSAVCAVSLPLTPPETTLHPYRSVVGNSIPLATSHIPQTM